jgi:hypothetical protein
MEPTDPIGEGKGIEEEGQNNSDEIGNDFDEHGEEEDALDLIQGMAATLAVGFSENANTDHSPAVSPTEDQSPNAVGAAWVLLDIMGAMGGDGSAEGQVEARLVIDAPADGQDSGREGDLDLMGNILENNLLDNLT